MQVSEYQRLAERTEADQSVVQHRIANNLTAVRLLHSLVGMIGELGEFACAIEKWLWYGQPLDVVNIQEELGDANWYQAEACNALGLELERILEANINKLRMRFPEKYNDEEAAEENRDRDKERQTLETHARLTQPIPHRTAAEVDEVVRRTSPHVLPPIDIAD